MNKMNYQYISRTMLWVMVLLSSLSTFAQNAMVGDGFGGRTGYCPVNYTLGNYFTAFGVCGSNNQLYAWGQNASSGFGQATPASSTTPVAVPGMTNVIQFRTGQAITAAIKSDGTGWVWGVNSPINFPTPTQVITDVVYCDAGDRIAYFIKKDGTVWAVGDATTCTGPAGNCAIQMPGVTTAKRVVPENGRNSIILLADGTVKRTFNPTIAPTTFAGLSNIVAVESRMGDEFFLNSAGQVYYALQGLTTLTLVSFPSGAAPIKALSTYPVGNGIMALDDNGNMYTWGYSTGGVLGNGINNSTYVSSPQLRLTNVRDIMMGNTTSYAVKNDGTLWATGSSTPSDGDDLYMDLSNTQRTTYTQINPTAVGLCSPTTACFTGMPICIAGTTAPAVTPTTATNSCPTTTVNLASLAVSSTTPSGASLIWSTHKTPTSAGDTLTTAQKTAVSTAGKYYAMYYDATNACYSPADSVIITITTCSTPISVSNTCPTATVNLMTAISTTNIPSGATITWHTGTPATTANKVTTPTAISTSGTYYMAFFDGTANCYSNASQSVTVTITTCTTPLSANTPAAQTASVGAAKTGNAATELAPTGGVSPYTYSNGAGDAACVAPSGATALTGLTVNSNGTYSYTAPATAGTYYYCIKVCDSATPTASCIVKTYTLTVSPNPLTANTPSAQSGYPDEVKTGNAATELAPTGGTSPYTYSLANNDAACVAPSGATAITGATTISINSTTGEYTYTVPSTLPNTSKTFYFCVKVCDSTSPTANCVVKTYTVNATAATLAIAATSADKAEGNSGTTPFTFTVTRSGNTTGPATATWYLVGTGANPVDAVDFAPPTLPKSGTVNFAAGETSNVITINVAGDNTIEPVETFKITLSNSGSSVITTAVANGTIQNDDVALSANDPAAQTASIGVAKTGNAATELAPTGGVSPYTYSNGAGDAACVAPSGATALTGLTVNSNGTYSYTAPATAGTYYYCIKVCDSATPTASCIVKTYTLTVSPNSLAANTPAAQSGYPTEVKTGNAATELAPTGGTSPYTYSLANNDAACVAPSGATAITGSTNISINSTTGEYTYTVPSTLPNTSKTFYFCVKVCDSTTPTASCVVKTYIVNATASTLAIAATSADKAEGNSGTTPFTFTVTRSGNTTGPASVGWYTGTGTNPVDATDFVPASLPMVGTVNFAAGETSKVITINVAGDNTIETDETFKVTLTNSGFSLVTTAVANATIQNDDYLDTDGDGVADDIDLDDDNDGISDATEGTADTDGDGVIDAKDLDADNDGINDVIEAGGTDANGDGKQDGTPNATTGQIGTGLTPPNSDNDTVPDYKDLDSDNDGVSDLQEGGSNGTDANNDGVVDGPDTDGDGIPNSVDGLTGYGDAASPALPNGDNDTTPDYKDVDSDGDGIMDIVEKAGKGSLDTNNDGMVDSPTDPDGDGIANNSGLDTVPTGFGGLPTATGPTADLFANYTFGNVTFKVNDTRTVIININEIKGGATNGTIEFFVPTMIGYTVTFTPSQTAATVIGAETVNNSDWTMTNTGTGMKFTSKAGVVIPANGRSRIALTIKADTAGTSANLTTNITPSSGGDGVSTNNVAVLGMSVQN